jgi:PAS domain S-box-containing protein
MREVDPLDLVETIREGLLVLEPDLTIRFANRSFCNIFAVAREDTVGRKLYELGNGQWDIPELRALIEAILPERAAIESFEVDRVFPSIGRRVMVLNARMVHRPGSQMKQILLAIEDMTERTKLERDRAAAHEHIAALLQELGHRIRNSLQIIASMISLEARNRKVGEGKAALERVSHRIAALGRLYSILGETNSVEEVDAAAYLEALCRDLIESLQKEDGISIALKTDIESEPLPADRAIPLGLIVNELVTNAIKHAFPSKTRGRVAVTLKRIPGELRLTVSDDGKGFDPRCTDSGTGGRLVEIFARQLGGQVERKRGNEGTIVCLTLPSREASSDREAYPRDKEGPRNVSD